MDDTMWRLPGPRGFVEEILREASRGRHVVAVVPEALAPDVAFTEHLATAILDGARNHFSRTYRAHPDHRATSVVGAFSELYFSAPTTVPELLTDTDVRGDMALLVGSDLPAGIRKDLRHFLERIERESRPLPQSHRLTVVVVATRSHLPEFSGGATSDVGLADVWFWGRVARWDVAAHIAAANNHVGNSVVDEVRAETIVEVAGWDLDVADLLIGAWSGDLEELRSVLPERVLPQGISVDHGKRLSAGKVPPPKIAALWDRRLVENWHHFAHVGVVGLSGDAKLMRTVWAAQARVLLPWIERRRHRLRNHIVNQIGAEVFATAVGEQEQPGSRTTDGVVEIGTLSCIARKALGYRHELALAARRLAQARNDLAHLRPLPLSKLQELVHACEVLD